MKIWWFMVTAHGVCLLHWEADTMPDNQPTDRDRAAERYWSMSRRKFLRGVGACVALPTLPSLWPRLLQAAEVAPSTAAAGVPRRGGFFTNPHRGELGSLWGNCDSGYSCAYQYNIAWRTATSPMPPEPNPRLVFERLFGAGSREERKKSFQARQDRDRSILDFIREDARSLSQQINPEDGRKLDEYLTSIREIERRIAWVEKLGEPANPDYVTPAGIPDPFEERMQVMFDMVALAFETDSTRIATLILSHDGSNRPFPAIDVPRGHHDLSHHQNKQENLDQIAKIDKHHMTYFAKFLDRLAHKHDADG